MSVRNPRWMKPLCTKPFLSAKPKRIKCRWFTDQLLGQIKTSEMLNYSIHSDQTCRNHKKFNRAFCSSSVGEKRENDEHRTYQPQLAVTEERIRDIRTQQRSQQEGAE